MVDGTTAPLRRPQAMTRDLGRCIECGVCDKLAPDVLARPGRITITPSTLEAMAACPVGALCWLEGEMLDGRNRHALDHREDP